MVDLWPFGKEAAQEAVIQTSNAPFPAFAVVVLFIFGLITIIFIIAVIHQWIKYGGKM